MEVSGRRQEKGDDDHTTGILCDPCKGVNEEENAVFYCTVCNEFLCEADAKAHRKAAVSKTHLLLDRNSMPKHKLGSHEDNICPIHREKILRYYCSTHSKGCCSLCATKEHRQCELEYIDDVAKGYETSSEYKTLVRDMTELMRRVQTTKQNLEVNKSNSLRVHSEIVSEIRKFRLEINFVLDSLENASLKEANAALDVNSNGAESIKTNFDALLAKLQEMTSSVENLRKYKQDRQLVIHAKEARTQVKDIEDKVSKLSDQNKRKDYKFVSDKAIPQLLRSLKSLGRLEITEKSTKSKENVQRAKIVTGAEVSIPVINQPVTASHVRDINIEHSTDTNRRCSIIGGVMLDQTKLVLVDSNNASVKVVDVINNTVISCIKLPSKPWDITRVEQDQVVVSCDGGKLVFLKVGKTLSVLKQLDLGGSVRGIAYTNNSLLVGFDSPYSCVKVIDLMGETMKTFKTDTAGNNLFKDPWYIALSKDQKTIFVSDGNNNRVTSYGTVRGVYTDDSLSRPRIEYTALSEDQNTIFVSDWDNGRVTSLRMDGTVRGVYTDDSLSYPHSLAVDRNDNVYVAGRYSDNILQLSAECKPIKVLLDSTHGIEYPCIVTYCKEEHKLYIGSYSNNYMSVFQLK